MEKKTNIADAKYGRPLFIDDLELVLCGTEAVAKKRDCRHLYRRNSEMFRTFPESAWPENH